MLSLSHLFSHHHHPSRLILLHPRTLVRPTSNITSSSSPTMSANNSHQTQEEEANIGQAIHYHNSTKHSFPAGYARGPHGLDWANQPNPFLRFTSAPHRPLLPLLPSQPFSDSPPYPSIFSSLPSSPPPKPLSSEFLSRVLFDSLSLSAWKSTGVSTWSLRVNPSSGNLHPTESHLISPPLPDLSSSPFLAHYSPKDHSLHFRAHLSSPQPFFSAADGNPLLYFVVSSVFWREAWKYGERALRYCNHDTGHAIAAIAISAAELGWDARLVDGLGHDELHDLLGLGNAYPSPPSPLPGRPVRGKFPWMEAQHPDCLLMLFPAGSNPSLDYKVLRDVISSLKSVEWLAKPNSLSKDHVFWDVIYRTAEAIKKPFTSGDGFTVNPFRSSGLISEGIYKGFSVHEVVRKRRSAVDMDGVHVMGRDTFYQILLHCLPSGELGPGEKQRKQFAMPFRVLTWDAEVHAALFVHRVADLPKGLYFLVRNEDHLESLKQAMRPEFEWKKPDGCPAGLPLFRLVKDDCQELANQLSCHQEIASDGCFSLGMIAHFEPVLRGKGAWMYPRLFWETGVLGQVLYLEAHAVGISATGIGCYFDDAVHEVLGLKGLEFQSLYHFTVGSPVLDKRIMSLPAYPGPGIDA